MKKYVQPSFNFLVLIQLSIFAKVLYPHTNTIRHFLILCITWGFIIFAHFMFLPDHDSPTVETKTPD